MKIGFVGLGNMGYNMVNNLLKRVLKYIPMTYLRKL